jgi:uroporphyrinogen decarboxylase
MTPCQRVLEALAHRQPDRVPFSWGFGPTPEMTTALEGTLAEQGVDWHKLRALTEDVGIVSPAYVGPRLPACTDIWGVRREPQSYGTGSYNEIVAYPLAGVRTPAELRSFPWPDPEAYDYGALRDQILLADLEGFRARKLNIDTCGNPFETYCWMTGLEESLVNIMLNPALVHAALEQIVGFFAQKMRRALACCGDLVHICYFADDLGGQSALLMSRKTYRDILQPYHRRLFSLVKDLAPGAAVMMHSDGAVFDVLPDLLDAGLEVLEAVQTDAEGMDPERLKDTYGDRLCFYGGISVQKLLPGADRETVYAECQRLIEAFGRGGGYIAAPTHAIQVGTPPENVLAMLRAVLGEADYDAALEGARL